MTEYEEQRGLTEREIRFVRGEPSFMDKVVGVGLFTKEVAIGFIRFLPHVLETRDPKKIAEATRKHELMGVLFRAQQHDPTLCPSRIEYLLGITDTDPHPTSKQSVETGVTGFYLNLS